MDMQKLMAPNGMDQKVMRELMLLQRQSSSESHWESFLMTRGKKKDKKKKACIHPQKEDPQEKYQAA